MMRYWKKTQYWLNNLAKNISRITVMRLPVLEAVIFLVGVLSFTSCEEIESSIGIGVLPETDMLGMADTTFSELRCYTMYDDSIGVDIQKSSLMLGSYEDPVLGSASAGILMSFEGDNQCDYEGSFVIDSMVLSMAYSGGFYGDAAQFQTIQIFDLTTQLDTGTDYYSNTDFTPYYSNDIIASQSVQPEAIESTFDITISDEIYLSKFNNGMDNIMTNFLNLFYGFYVTTDSTQTGAIMFMDLSNSNNKLKVYYKTQQKLTGTKDTVNTEPVFWPISKMCEFTFGSSTKQINVLAQQHSAAVTNSIGNVADELLFVQSMGGLRSIIELPDITNLYPAGTAITRAELVFPIQENSNDTFSPHVKLGLAALAEDNKLYIMADQNEDHFGGTYDTENEHYAFNISRHVQQLILRTDPTPRKVLHLLATGRSLSANRTIIQKKSNSSTEGVQLKLWFTNLN